MMSCSTARVVCPQARVLASKPINAATSAVVCISLLPSLESLQSTPDLFQRHLPNLLATLHGGEIAGLNEPVALGPTGECDRQPEVGRIREILLRLFVAVAGEGICAAAGDHASEGLVSVRCGFHFLHAAVTIG